MSAFAEQFQNFSSRHREIMRINYTHVKLRFGCFLSLPANFRRHFQASQGAIDVF
jgi:hypothetical protein